MPTITLEDRRRIRFLAEEGGLGARAIYRYLLGMTKKISLSGIQRLLTKIRRHDTIANLSRPGRPRTIRIEYNINRVRTMIEEKRGLISYTTLQRHLGISKPSLQRILKKDLNLFCYKPVRTQKLSPQSIIKRLAYSSFLIDTYIPRLNQIIFSDESYFSVNESIHPQNSRIWSSHPKKRDVPIDILTRPSISHSKKVMIWAAISQRGKLPLIFFDPGLRLTSKGYRHLVLRSAIPEMKRLYPEGSFIFQQDGASSHTARATKAYLANKQVTLMEKYPPQSPDLSPLDYFVFGTLKYRVYSPPTPSTLDELKAKILLEWEKLPVSMIIKAINQFPKRLRMVIETKGHVIQHLLDTIKHT